MNRIITNKCLIICTLITIIVSFSIYAKTESTEQRAHSAETNNNINRYAEAMFRIGFITIENPVVIECETGKETSGNNWRIIRYVTSINHIQQIIANGTIHDSEHLYILCDELSCPWDRLYWDVIYAQHPNLRPNDSVSFIDALGDFNQDFECCKLLEWKTINDSIRLLRYDNNPACFALALVNIAHYNSKGIAIDGPKSYIYSEKPKSSYVKCVAPVCDIENSLKMPELLPWCVKGSIGHSHKKPHPVE